MSIQFNLNKSPMGDITIQGGVIVDTTQSPTASILIGHDIGEAVQLDPDTNSYTPAPVPSGGSGRNIIIQKTPYAGLPDGVFFPFTDYEWFSSNYGSNFKISYGISGGLIPDSQEIQIADQTGIIATAPIGTIESKISVQCSALVENGGPTSSGGLVKWVYFGTTTGIVNFTYNSTIGNCRFVVQYNNANVIDVSGSGTASFNKTATRKFAKVIIYSLTEDAKWDFNLGCPGGGSAPFTPPTGRVTFNATLTTYGLTLTGGVNIPLVCTYEGDPNIKTCSVTSEDILGVYEMRSDAFQRFYNESDYKTSIQINPLQCVIMDYNDVIAIRPTPPGFPIDENLTDPTGLYESTPYGANIYNSGVPFNVYVQLNQNPSLTLVHYYVLNLTGGGSIASYEGPISAPSLPANTATKKHIPVASFDATSNTLLQLWEGAILWR